MRHELVIFCGAKHNSCWKLNYCSKCNGNQHLSAGQNSWKKKLLKVSHKASICTYHPTDCVNSSSKEDLQEVTFAFPVEVPIISCWSQCQAIVKNRSSTLADLSFCGAQVQHRSQLILFSSLIWGKKTIWSLLWLFYIIMTKLRSWTQWEKHFPFHLLRREFFFSRCSQWLVRKTTLQRLQVNNE